MVPASSWFYSHGCTNPVCADLKVPCCKRVDAIISLNRTCRSCAGDAALISKLLQCMFRDSRPAVVEGGVGMFQGARISESPQVEDPTLFEILDKLLELA